MRIAILADNADNFVKPRAEGLQRMLARLGVESDVWYDGLYFLDHNPKKQPLNTSNLKTLVKTGMHYLFPPQTKFFEQKWKQLSGYQAIVVVETVPTAFLTYQLGRIEEIRIRLPQIPVVLYSSIYLSTLGEWIRFLKEGNDYHGFIKGNNHFGLERYDWYLIGSATTENEMPEGFQPLSVIGCNINDGSLYPEQNGDFLALVDFERPNHMLERAVQIMALEKTKTPYKVLNGRYPMAEIRKIYRSTSIYFLAHLEAFGLPIAEVQACGGQIFTPYSRWAWAHYHKPDLTKPGPGTLSENFKVYHNDPDLLCDMIVEARSKFDAQKNLSCFKKWDGKFLDGDLTELEQFISRLKTGEINSRLHTTFAPLNQLIKES